MVRFFLSVSLLMTMVFISACAASTESTSVDSYFESGESSSASTSIEKTEPSKASMATISSEKADTNLISRPAPIPDEYWDTAGAGEVQERFIDAKNLQDLEKNSVLIVKGFMLDHGVEYLDIRDHETIGCTVRSFQITETIKGNIASGESIKIAEPYYLDESSYERVVLENYFGYMPSEIEKEYLFFLKSDAWPDSTSYRPVFTEQGRYPVIDIDTESFSTSTLTPRDVSLANGMTGEVSRWEAYLELYAEVIEKYM